MKKANPNTQKKAVPKKDRTWEEYLNTVSHQIEPANDATLRRMGIELLIYARENARAYSVDSFLNMKGIGWKTWHRWMEKNEQLRECHETAINIFCDRKNTGALERKLDGNYVKWSMAFQSPQYREYEEWRSKLSKDKEESTQKIVVIERFTEKE